MTLNDRTNSMACAFCLVYDVPEKKQIRYPWDFLLPSGQLRPPRAAFHEVMDLFASIPFGAYPLECLNTKGDVCRHFYGPVSKTHCPLRNPPLQNIPIRTEIGRKIADAFTGKLPSISADYAGLEHRVLGQMMGGEIVYSAGLRYGKTTLQRALHPCHESTTGPCKP